MMTSRLAVLLCASFFACVVTRAQPAPRPIPVQTEETCPRPPSFDAVPDQPVEPALAAALAEGLNKAAAKSACRPLGLSVAVLVPGHGYWAAQSGVDGHGNAVAVATRFHAASAGKLVTGALVARAAGERRLDLAAPIGSAVPDLPKAWQSIRLSMFLNHTSGLGTFDENPRYDRSAAAAPRQLLALTPTRLLFASGTAHRYSNSGYILLGLAAEHASGLTWEEEVRRTFFDRLPYCHFLTAAQVHPEDLAVGHIEGRPIPFLPDYRNVWSCGGIVCSALDLARLYDAATALLYGGQVRVQEGTISVWAGRGINRVDTPSGTYLQHHGGIPGFVCTAGLSSKTGVTVAVLSNDASFVPDNAFFGLCLAAASYLEVAAAKP
jgi:CubicO group peptidase (beta-lactamase class C family)